MGKGEMKPLLLKVGVALFLSFAGFLYAQLKCRGDRRGRRRDPPPAASSVVREGVESGREVKELGTQCEEEPSDMKNGSTFTEVTFPTVGLFPGSKNLGDEEYLLPEFNELVLREFESVRLDPDATEGCPLTDGLLPDKEEKARRQEIINLKNLVQLLQERVASLEIQLLEYYGLKEQESAVKELENHLKVNTVEAKLLSLRIESLQAENQSLGAQLSDYSRIKSELESARAKIRHLEKKLRLDSLQANEMVTALHQRIAALQDGEHSGEGANEEAEKRLKHLEEKAAELRRENSKLAMENSDMEKKLSSQILAPSALESTEATKELEELDCLREANDNLTKEIAQLQIDRCADVEELVYLRWVNACLRYELRNYQPHTGKTVARDLNRTLSPDSEQKAKQLILEYANSGVDERSINLMDFYLEYCSSSQASSSSENGEVDDSLVDANTSTKSNSSSKTKFLTKLKKLVLGKDTHRRTTSVDRSTTSCGMLDRRPSVSACSSDDIMDRHSYDSIASCVTSDNGPGNRLLAFEQKKVHERQQNEAPWTRNLSRVSLDFRKLKSQEEFGEIKRERSKSDVGDSYWHTVGFGDGSLLGSPLSVRTDHEIVDLHEKLEMTRDAHASKSAHRKPKLHTRSASSSLC